jgi:dTDP-L-rhamnose 4-epimerase
MKILLIGGAGFIGKNFVKKYSKNNEIYVIDSLDPLVHGSDLNGIKSFLKTTVAGYLIADYISKESIDYIELIKPEVIITMASQTGTADGNIRVNYYISENVNKFSEFIYSIKNLKSLKRVIHLSTRAVYGNGCSLVKGAVIQNGYRNFKNLSQGDFKYDWENGSTGEYLSNQIMQPTAPVSIYGVTKLAQEGLLSSLAGDCEWDFVILRLQNVIGDGQSLLNPYTGLTCWFAQAAINGNDIEIYENGEIWRDFIDVQDVVDSIYGATLNNLINNQIIDIGSGIPTNLIEYAKLIISKANSKSKIVIVKKYRIGDIRWAAANIINATKTGLYSNKNRLEETVKNFIDGII